MNNINQIIKENIQNFVRSKIIKSGIKKDEYLFGYLVADLESRPEKIRAFDLFQILKRMATVEEIYLWYLDNQIEISKIKKRNNS